MGKKQKKTSFSWAHLFGQLGQYLELKFRPLQNCHHSGIKTERNWQINTLPPESLSCLSTPIPCLIFHSSHGPQRFYCASLAAAWRVRRTWTAAFGSPGSARATPSRPAPRCRPRRCGVARRRRASGGLVQGGSRPVAAMFWF